MPEPSPQLDGKLIWQGLLIWYDFDFRSFGWRVESIDHGAVVSSRYLLQEDRRVARDRRDAVLE